MPARLEQIPKQSGFTRKRQIEPAAHPSEWLAMAQNEPMRITFMRSRLAPRAFLVDANLDLHSLEELRDWAARKVDFIAVDESSGEDITRVLLA